MITKEELIKHKWKYNESKNQWEKLGVVIRDKLFNSRYHIMYPVTLITCIDAESVEILEDRIKYDVKNYILSPVFGGSLTLREKRTLKNWIL